GLGGNHPGRLSASPDPAAPPRDSPGGAGIVRSRRIPGHDPYSFTANRLMQTMTLASYDTDVAELPWHRRRAGPGTRPGITAVALRKSAAGKRRGPAPSLASHFPGIREDRGNAFHAARLRAGYRAAPQAGAIAAGRHGARGNQAGGRVNSRNPPVPALS